MDPTGNNRNDSWRIDIRFGHIDFGGLDQLQVILELRETLFVYLVAGLKFEDICFSLKLL